MNKNIILLLLLGVVAGVASAQNPPYSDKYLARHPVWIDMMDNPQANYFETVHAFDVFWKGKVLPVEEEEVLGDKFSVKEKKEEGFWQKLWGNRKEEEAEKYAFQVKKFHHWQRAVLPFVQEDGRILSKEEIRTLWENKHKQ